MKVSRAVIAHVSAAMRAALDRDAPDSDEGQALAAAAVLAVTLHQTFGKDGARSARWGWSSVRRGPTSA